ncbi:hypothetical protein HY633_04355 [Candidatus Uhrbacteria bacterium]|nr:hypothetical protein [Candidatus Uhrbacteria bacterium]
MMQLKGIAALPTILIISLLVLIAGAGILGTSLVEDAVTSGDKESREAIYAAEAGIHDAIVRLARNKECNNGVAPSCTSFSLAVGDASTAVTVAGASTPKTITSVGTRKNKTRTLQAVVSIDANHKVSVTSWSEITP